MVRAGLHERGFHPKIYMSAVLPCDLYGSKLWTGLSNINLLKLERALRFCLKHTQHIPKHTKTDVCLSLIGSMPFAFEIDKMYWAVMSYGD